MTSILERWERDNFKDALLQSMTSDKLVKD